MKYLGLAYYNPDKFAAMAPDDVQALVSQCPPMDEKMRATGKVLVSASLSEPKDWMTLRPRGGKPQISDGPYTESKEMLGGLFIIEAGSRDEAVLPQGLSWRLRPDWAQGLALRLSIYLPCCAPDGIHSRIRPLVGGLQWTLEGGQSRWPAAVLAGLGTPWNTLMLDGDVRLQTPGLSMRWMQGRLQLDGSLQVEALALSSRLSTLSPLGSYRLILAAPEGANARLNLNTLEGALRLSGEGQWVGGRLRFNGEAQASEEHEATLSNLLNIVGKRSGRRSLIALG